jgi:hypothetical protein
MCILSINVNLLKKIKLYFTILEETLNFFGISRFLVVELIAWKGKNSQTCYRKGERKFQETFEDLSTTVKHIKKSKYVTSFKIINTKAKQFKNGKDIKKNFGASSGKHIKSMKQFTTLHTYCESIKIILKQKK